MSSKMMMVRSSIRSLIQTSIRPAAAAATMMSTQPPVSIYTGLNAITTRPPVIFHSGFCSNGAAGGGVGDGGHFGESDLNDVKNEEYDSDDMKFVFEGADDDVDDDDDGNDDEDDVDPYDSDYITDSDDDRGKREYDSDD